MPENVVFYVTRYGYLAIFILVFLQEVGLPNPFPNELLLIFSGYLTFSKILFLPMVILTALSADFVAANILYLMFYKAGAFVLQKKPRWIPLSADMIDRLSAKISKEGNVSIFIFRVTPFTRGYTSVISGLIHIKPKIYLPIVVFSGITWAAFWVISGYLIGPFWNQIEQLTGEFKIFMLIVLVVAITIVILSYCVKKKIRDGNHLKS
jgi:membrane protein DedA with SNARE-associated domain